MRGTADGQPKARALRIGAQISELNSLLQSQPSSEKELRALEHDLLHLATILKVPWVQPWVFLTTAVALTPVLSPPEQPLSVEVLLTRGDSGYRRSPGEL